MLNKNQKSLKRAKEKKLKRRDPSKPVASPEDAPMLAFKAQLEAKLGEAFINGQLVLALFYMNGDEIQLFRKSIDFPADDFPTCLKMLEEDLKKEAERITSSPPLPKPKKPRV